jgi:hypothetical protein
MFEFSADARFEFVHPADAGAAFARALDCEKAVGKILYVGGGEKCQMTHREFSNELMRAIGIGAMPAEAFVRTEVPRFFGDWVDSEESQRLLQYQKRGLDELKADMRKSLGVVAPLVRLLRPVDLVRPGPYLEENCRAGRCPAASRSSGSRPGRESDFATWVRAGCPRRPELSPCPGRPKSGYG